MVGIGNEGSDEGGDTNSGHGGCGANGDGAGVLCFSWGWGEFPRGPGTLSVGGLRLGGHTLKTGPYKGPMKSPRLSLIPCPRSG